jgi:hypothetical protein
MPQIMCDSAEAVALELLIIVARVEGVHLDQDECGWSKDKILATYRECLATVKGSGAPAAIRSLAPRAHRPI